jgi:hypothetical protein
MAASRNLQRSRCNSTGSKIGGRRPDLVMQRSIHGSSGAPYPDHGCPLIPSEKQPATTTACLWQNCALLTPMVMFIGKLRAASAIRRDGLIGSRSSGVAGARSNLLMMDWSESLAFSNRWMVARARRITGRSRKSETTNVSGDELNALRGIDGRSRESRSLDNCTVRGRSAFNCRHWCDNLGRGRHRRSHRRGSAAARAIPPFGRAHHDRSYRQCHLRICYESRTMGLAASQSVAGA